MKKIGPAICVFLLLTHGSSAQQKSLDQYTIRGQVSGVDSGTVRMLSLDGESIVDSVIVRSGKFTFRGRINIVERRVFILTPGHYSFQAFVEPGDITVSVDTAGAQHYGVGTNSWALIWHIIQKGSPAAAVYRRLEEETRTDYFHSVIYKKHDSLRNIMIEADRRKLENAIDSLSNTATAIRKRWIEAFIKNNPASPAGPYIFQEFFSRAHETLRYLDSVLNLFSGEAKASVYYKQLFVQAETLRMVQPGMPAPDFELQKPDGKRFRLSSVKEKLILLDFWASWCGPCRAAIPEWKRVYQKYKGDRFVIISLSGDRQIKDWQIALNKERMPWVQLIDEFPSANSPSRVSESYGVRSLPFYVVIGKDGNVVLNTGKQDEAEKAIARMVEQARLRKYALFSATPKNL